MNLSIPGHELGAYEHEIMTDSIPFSPRSQTLVVTQPVISLRMEIVGDIKAIARYDITGEEHRVVAVQPCEIVVTVDGIRKARHVEKIKDIQIFQVVTGRWHDDGRPGTDLQSWLSRYQKVEVVCTSPHVCEYFDTWRFGAGRGVDIVPLAFVILVEDALQ